MALQEPSLWPLRAPRMPKRARDLQKTMDSQQKRLQSVTEPLKDFPEQMTHILTMAQTFQQQNHDRENSASLNGSRNASNVRKLTEVLADE